MQNGFTLFTLVFFLSIPSANSGKNPRYYVQILSSSAFDNNGRSIASPTPVNVDLLYPDDTVENVPNRGQKMKVAPRHIQDDGTRLRIVIRRGSTPSLPCVVDINNISKRPHIFFCRMQTYMKVGTLSVFHVPINEYAQVKVYSE